MSEQEEHGLNSDDPESDASKVVQHGDNGLKVTAEDRRAFLGRAVKGLALLTGIVALPKTLFGSTLDADQIATLTRQIAGNAVTPAYNCPQNDCGQTNCNNDDNNNCPSYYCAKDYCQQGHCGGSDYGPCPNQYCNGGDFCAEGYCNSDNDHCPVGVGHCPNGYCKTDHCPATYCSQGNSSCTDMYCVGQHCGSNNTMPC